MTPLQYRREAWQEHPGRHQAATPTSKLVDTRQRPPTGFQPAAAAASATSTAPAFHPVPPPQQQQQQQQQQQPQHAHTMKALAQQLLQGQWQQQQLSDQGASSASFVMCSHMVQKGVTNKHVMKQLAQLEDQLCKVVFKGEAGSRPQMQRVYALPGSFGLPPDGPAARDALPSLAKFKERFIKQHQQDRWGFLRVKVDAKPEMGATAALEKLNQYSLLLLTWRLQHHPNLPARWGGWLS
ncbi:hypothetical protein OEZ86_002826 [Tetradesmus obliquus]|nr:hypothetical protein OEZ86_002826 [Tetradesmus obliquus]